MKKYIPIILILLLAAILRLFALSSYPSGLNADEAALGYNAYSLLLTGKDEHGNLFPVNLESFGDFKPALYAYLLVPIVKIFGLTEFAVRLPSALFGILGVYLIYIYVKYLSSNPSPESGEGNKRGEVLALLSSILLAISPWALHFSRGAWEVNVSTTLILLGIIFFLRWIKDHKFISIAYCLVPFSLSMYTYQSARILAPILGLGLVIINWKFVIGNIKQSLTGFILAVVLLIPLSLSLIFTDATSRVGGVGLLADQGPTNFVNEIRGQHSGLAGLITKIFHNRPVIYTLQFIKNYLSHFDGNFLFVNGDEIQRNKIPETGLLYLTDFILLFVGIVFISQQLMTTNNHRVTTVLLFWLAIAPLASSMTFQVPHALRAHNMTIPLTIISACGLYYIINKISLLTPLFDKERGIKGVSSNKVISLFLTILFISIYLWQFSRYLHQYYIHYPQTYPIAWQYGFSQIADYVKINQDRYRQVLITDKYDQPYILLLFFLKYPPLQFQGHHQLTYRDQYNFSTVKTFDKYTFTDTSWDKVRDIHNCLIIAAADDIPSVGVNIVHTINFPNGSPAFKIISN